MVVTETPKKKPGKKRGRKPKVAKKRGRKPSSKVVSKEDLEKEDCIIAHLPININDTKKSSNDEQTSSITEISLDNCYNSTNKNVFDNKYITFLENKVKKLENKLNKISNYNMDNLKKMDFNILKVKSNLKCEKTVELKKNNNKCWWCCHNFDNLPFVLPDKFINNKFYVYGNFCSPNCCLAYNLDLKDDKVVERTTLINKLYNSMSEEEVECIYPAPLRQTLECFGGDLSINEFRCRSLKYYSNRLLLYPMVPLLTLIEESYKDRNKYNWNNKDVQNNRYNNLVDNMKLRRSKKKTQTSIEKIMKLKKIKI